VTSHNVMGTLVRVADNVDDSQLPPAQKQAASSAKPTRTPGAATPRSIRPAPVHPAGRSAPARPAPPEGGVDAGTPPAIASGAAAGSTEAAGRRPQAVFRTDPPASASGRITDGAPFEVTFDLCASKSADSAHELTFSFDFDGDGVADESGSCRQTRRYELGPPGVRCVKSVACVGDGERGHESCRTYTICRSERSASPR